MGEIESLPTLDPAAASPNDLITVLHNGKNERLTIAGVGSALAPTTGAYADAGDANLNRLGINVGVEPVVEINPARVRDFTFQRAASFGGSNFLAAAAASSDFDFSGSSQFSVIFWRKPYWHSNSSGNGLDQTYVSIFADDATSADSVFALKSGGSVGQGNSLQIWVATNSSGTTFASATTPVESFGGSTPCSPLFTMGAATYDGTQGTSTNRALLYLDGIDPGKSNYTTSGTLPATLQAASSGLVRIGGQGGSSYPDLFNGAVWNVGIFKGRVLTPTEIKTLYNNGVSQNYQQLVESGFDMTGCVGFWNCDEDGPVRYDRTGNGHNLSPNSGIVPMVSLVKQYVEAGQARLTMKPIKNKYNLQDGTTGKLGNNSELCLASAPIWVGSVINGQPALLFHGGCGDHLYAAVPQWLDLSAMEFFSVNQFVTVPTGETFNLFSAGEIDDLKYFGFGWSPYDNTGTLFSPAKAVGWIRVRNSDAGGPGDTGLVFGTSLLVNTTYVENYRVLGSGNAASFEHRVNGNADTPSYLSGSPQNTGPNSVVPRDNITVGSLTRSTGPEWFGAADWYLARQIAYPPLTQDQNRAIEAGLRTLFGV